MPEIRVTYSGLISFAIGLVGIITGLVYSLIVTRTLTQTDYGTWALIVNLISYVIILEPIISYWVTRETARNVDSGKTAISCSGFFSLGGISAYVVIAFIVGVQAGVGNNILFFAAIQIPFIFLNRTLSAINMGWKPNVVSYGILSFGITQVITSLIFVYFLHMGVKGVILTNIFSSLASNIILFLYARGKIKNKIRKEFVVKWFKLSWISLYPGMASVIRSMDVAIFSVITHSVIGLAYWSASLAISTLVQQAGLISSAVYPKLLGDNERKYLQENLTQMSFVAMPLAAIAITSAKPMLFALNPIYVVAVPIVIMTTFLEFSIAFSAVFQYIITGAEKIDTYKNSVMQDYFKSKLFLVPKISMIQSSLHVGSLAVMLILLVRSTNSTIDLVIYWSIIAVLTHVPFTIYFYTLVRKDLDFKLDFSAIFKYMVISAGVFGITYVLSDHFLEYDKNNFEFLPHLFFFIALGVGSYLLVAYITDARTQQLFKAIIEEIKGKKI